MEYKKLHRWDVPPKKAIEIQNNLKKRIILKPFEGEPQIVAGVDLSFPERKRTLAVIVLIEYPTLNLISYTYEVTDINYPYIPGLLVFREGPAFLKAWEKLEIRPDLVIFDGQGIAHPRGIGIASHMGLFIDIPTIGVAKSKLYGKHDPLAEDEGSYVPLYGKSERNVIGYVYRGAQKKKPIYISPGHLTDPESSLKLVMKMTLKGKRLPEPTRIAHILTQKLKKEL